MAYIADAGVEVANPLKKAIVEQQKPYTIQDLSNQVNNDLLKYDSMGVKPNVEVLAKGGLTTTDYSNMVSSLKTPTVTPTVTPTPTPLAQAVVQQTPQYTPVQYTPVRDNSGLINDSYSNLISALKAQIQQAQNNKNLDINGLPAKYQKDKNTSEVQKANELRTALEMSANSGDRGGVGRQQALETVANGDNRLNAINLQQTAEETSLRNDIANLVLEGNIQQAQLQSERLKDLLSENIRVDETNYNRATNADNVGYSRLRDSIGDTRYNSETTYNQGQDSFNNNLKLADILGTYNGQQTMQGRQADATYQGSILNNEAQAIQNKYAPQIAQGTIDANSLSNAYQTMVNANYPKEESAKIAGILAQNIGIKLSNDAQALANKYYPQIQQGQIDGQKLQNAYQKLVNNGYSASVAADIASKYANIAQGNAQIAISQQNANTSSASQAWAQNPNNPDNIYKQTQIKQANPTTKELTAKQDADLRAKAAQMATTQEGTFDAGVADTIYKYLKGQATGTNTTSSSDLDAMRKAGLIK